MEELTLIDKFKILFESILNHPLFIILFFVPIILFFLQKKHGKKVYIIVYFISIFLILIIGGNDLFKLFDNFMDGLFMVLYFPNFITLFVVALLSAMFGFISLFSRSMHRINKVINYIFFGIIQSLFILIILTIRANKINIYKDNALYSNSDILSLMQIMIGAFGVQLVSLMIIKLINKITSILDSKDPSFSKDVNKQISLLSETKNTPIDVNDTGVGYINVADKKKSSIPILKPFKFDLSKLENIRLNVISKPKILRKSKLESDNVTYLNEVTKPYKTSNLNSSDASYLNEVIKPYKTSNLSGNDASYLNEVTKPYKTSSLSGNDASYLNEVTKPYKMADLSGSDASYLNEVTKPYKMADLSGSDASYLNEVTKPYKTSNLNGSDASYLNEVIKPYKTSNLNGNDTSYLNEVIKPYKPSNLNSSNISYLNEVDYSKGYKYLKLDSSKIVLLNVPKITDAVIENIKNKTQKEYKIIDIDYNKIINLEINDKPYHCLTLSNKNFSYLNEIILKKNYKFVKLDSSKVINLKTKNPLFKNVILNFDSLTYLNEIKKDYNIIDLRSTEIKDVSLNEQKKPFSFVDLKDKAMSYLHEIIKKSAFKPSTIDDNKQIQFKTEKPDLLAPMNIEEKPNVTEEKAEEMSVLNLRIVDIQSALDVISKYHLMKDVKLEGYKEKDAVDNLEISDFELLLGILKRYKISNKNGK